MKPGAVIAIIGGIGLLFFSGKKIMDLKDVAANKAKFGPVIAAAEQANHIPVGLLMRLINEESHFRSDIISGAVRSPTGAVGIAQFEPSTAADEGVNPLDPIASINGAARYLVKLYKSHGNDWTQAVASYDWGGGSVKKAVLAHGSGWLSYAPLETRNYVAAVV